MHLHLVGAAIFLAMSICHAAVPAAPGQVSTPAGAEWRLVAFTGDGHAVDVPEGITITARFATDGRFDGSAGCNRYFGHYALEGDRLVISALGATRRACPPETMAVESRYLALLEATRWWTRDGRHLTLTDRTGEHGLQMVATGGDAASEVPAAMVVGRTQVFHCPDPRDGGFRFTLRTGPGEAALWLPPRFGRPYLVLGQVPAASGTRYEGDGVVVWNKGPEAMLEVEEKRFSGCRPDPRAAVWAEARRRGVDFRATGNEPPWHLEVSHGEDIRFIHGYGRQEVRVPIPGPAADPAEGATRYHAATADRDLEVVIEDTPCTDTMSGEHFEATVTVRLDGKRFRGCGRTLGR